MAEETKGGEIGVILMDEKYEFSAPRFFDFMREESEDELRNAELWFETALAYAPSPFMPRIKTGRSLKTESLCDFSEAENADRVPESSYSADNSCSSESQSEAKITPAAETKEAKTSITEAKEEKKVDDVKEDATCAIDNRGDSSMKSSDSGRTEVCSTPQPMSPSQNGRTLTNSKKHQSAKHIASLVRNPSALKSKQSQAKGVKPAASAKKVANSEKPAGTPNYVHENQAIKRQKLDEGRSRQIINLKPPQPLLHKSKPGLSGRTSSLCLTANKKPKEERKIYVREPAVPPVPFVSTAELLKKFQSSTREMSLTSISHTKPKLSLTRPKEPEFETSQRVRSVKIKSTAELEEEMMAKIPKFKARPLNKKIFQAPALPPFPRSTPKLPEFQEFHLETTARAIQNAETASVASTEASTRQNNQWKPHLTEPKTPVLQTSMRARPPRVKSSVELEKEELEKIPKFKAKPLNKKIFESKGELGIFCNTKKQVTIPQEFHFATNERIPPPAAVADLFDKLSLNSEPRHDPLPKNTIPNPFHLHTEERGAEKEKIFVIELVHKQIEEERARVPRANPYPYTTDYPVIPVKPEPKPCTKPEPFQLESLLRHEEEIQRERVERERMEREAAQIRIFKAQPVLKEDPIPVPEKVRRPLTQVQGFNLHVEHRASERAEFDQKVKEKEQLYKRYREESEAAKMIEEEKALKQLRRTMVPHARPVPNFDRPFCPQKSNKGPTKAKSPNLQVIRRKERKRMMMNAFSSSPASCLR